MSLINIILYMNTQYPPVLASAQPVNSFAPVQAPTYVGQTLQYPPPATVMGSGLVQPGYVQGVNYIPQGSVAMPGMVVNPVIQGVQAPMISPSVRLQSNVSEQQVVIPQPPQSQIVQEVRRIPMQVAGPHQREVVRNYTQRVVTIPQPPEVRVINETIRKPVVVPQPPQIQTVYDKVPRTVMVPVPPEIIMQRSEVVEGPFISRPAMPFPNLMPQPIIGSAIQAPLAIPISRQNIIQPPIFPQGIPSSSNVIINSYSPTAVIPQGQIAIANPVVNAVPNPVVPVIPEVVAANPIVENPIPSSLPPESGFFKQSESIPQPSILVDNRPL